MKQPEGLLVSKIVKRIKDRFPTGYVVKIADRMTRGIPDVLAIVCGASGTLAVLLLEVKTPKGKVQAIQEHTLAKLQSIAKDAFYGSLEAHVVRSVEDVDSIMDGIR